MCLALPSLKSTKELITFPNAERDLLIIPASFNHSPPADVNLAHSEPARSMIWKRDTLTFQRPSLFDLLSMIVVKTEWDLEDSLFIEVEPTCLLRVPRLISSYISEVFATVSSVRPSQ